MPRRKRKTLQIGVDRKKKTSPALEFIMESTDLDSGSWRESRPSSLVVESAQDAAVLAEMKSPGGGNVIFVHRVIEDELRHRQWVAMTSVARRVNHDLIGAVHFDQVNRAGRRRLVIG
jgi:hypothetical protein